MTARKDNKGRVLGKGEFQRAYNGKYATREVPDTINYVIEYFNGMVI